VLGTLTEQAAAELGLPRAVKVVAGSPDHQSACIGSGAVGDYQGHLYVGTSSWVQCVVPFKKTDVLHSIASLPTAIPGRYQSVNEQDIAGGALTFLVEKLLYGDPRLHTEGPPDDIFAQLDQVAADAAPGSGNLLFTPWLNGERTPIDDEAARACLIGLSTTTTQADVIRALFEGVAYNTRWSLQYVEKFVGRRLDPIRIVGGGGKSELWCRIFADVLDREIHQVTEPMQANARGAALIAAVGLGHTTFDRIPGTVAVTQRFRPDPANRRVYDRLFEEFVGFYRRNKKMFERLRSRGT
jgi:xylulokinase